jgi:hypothetical protein
MANSHFCSQTCTDDADKNGPMILEVPQGHSTFKSGMNAHDFDFRNEIYNAYQLLINSSRRGGTEHHVHL